MPLGSNTLSASEIQLDSVESYPLSPDQWPESSSFPIEPRTHALPPAISSVSGQPAPTEPISEVPDPSNSALFEFLRRLERNGQDIRENLLELHMEIRTLKEENMRLRQQQSNAPPAFVCGTNANANVHGGQWQPDGLVSHGGSQLAFNGGNYFAPGQQGPNSHNGGYVRQNEYWNSRNDSQASRMSPPESPPDRLNLRRRASPYQPIEDRTRWKKWWDVGPDGLNRAPAREQNDLGNAGSLANSRPIEVHHHQDVNNQCERKRTRSDTAEPPRRPRYDEPRMNRQRHVSMNDDYKRRKFVDEELPPAQPSSSSLQLYMPVQSRIEEDDPYVPDEFASLPPARPVIPTGPRRDARLQTHAR
ncbi:uncharacterized protein FOMMEDRAFT_141480 [Fomitiporia mediterranea MF3/22]|uniref:uncharacterized protein n=1 Tax=Fomitiporia mediterranea (strain MF3/22) TaxID=694068 RepID=UPI0004409756|nr:uncharacterized protein FOMMEDRAFT_141480 [Fomitiporia mediterranea MF3/22]EJD02444.1 hypothetical protein FOMMEDRAFT_141480 [Fomitiporia mediterranea MF3/22]